MSDTRILYFREWQGYSFSSLKAKLSGFLSLKADEKRRKDKVNSIIDRLVRARFLKAFRKPKDDIGEILDGEEIEGDYNNDDNRIIYGFKYVGLIEIDGIIMYVYPKYIDNFDDYYKGVDDAEKVKIKDAKKIIAVLRKYKNESLKFKLGNRDEEQLNSNDKLPFELFLLEDYFKNGIYVKTESVIVENGNGEIDWVMTINETDAIIRNNKPYYTTLLTNDANSDSNDFITRLHEAIISDISRELSKNGLLDLFGISPALLTPLKVDQLDSSDSKSYAIHCLERELRVQYITQKRRLLKALIGYLTAYSSKTRRSSFAYYGTTAFNLVFERACADVFGDVKDKKPSELIESNMINAGSFSVNCESTLKQSIDKPLWKIGGKGYSAKETLEPDVVVVGKNSDDSSNRSNYFVILDAKYYLINLKDVSDGDKNGHISGQPGVGDIIKQYAYMQSYLKKNLKNRNKLLDLLNVTKTLNAFVFPKRKFKKSCAHEQSPLICFGDDDCVSMSFFDSSPESDIRILEVDPDALFDSYLKGEKNPDVIGKTMHYEELKARTRELKESNSGGKDMGDVIRELVEKGREQGREEGREEGMQSAQVKIVRTMLGRGL